MQIGAGNRLKGLRVANCEEIGLSYVRSDRDVCGKFEMDGQRQEFLEVEQVRVCNHWHMEDECELICGWVIELRDIDLEQV